MPNRALVVSLVAVFVLMTFFALAFVAGFGAGVPEAGFFLAVLGLILLNAALVIGAIVHALVRDDLTGVQRIVWVAIAFFVTPVVALGAIVYFALGRERTATLFRDVERAVRPPASPPTGP